MMEPLHRWPEEETTSETARLARKADDHVGEDNVIPWLLVHHQLVRAALRGRKVGLRAAVEQVLERRN